MALLLAGAMVLSGMGISPLSAQAEEVIVEQVQKTEPLEEQVKETVSDGNAEITENVGRINDIVSNPAEKIADEAVVQAAETAVPVVQSTDGQYVFDAATDSVVSKLDKKAR